MSEFEIGNFRVELWEEGIWAITAEVDGEDELEWLDDEGDLTPEASHLHTNRQDVYDEDEIEEIRTAMQEFIDELPAAKRNKLRADCRAAVKVRAKLYG